MPWGIFETLWPATEAIWQFSNFFNKSFIFSKGFQNILSWGSKISNGKKVGLTPLKKIQVQRVQFFQSETNIEWIDRKYSNSSRLWRRVLTNYIKLPYFILLYPPPPQKKEKHIILLPFIPSSQLITHRPLYYTSFKPL